MYSTFSCKLHSFQPAGRGAERFIVVADWVQHACIQIAQPHGTARDGKVVAVLEAAFGEFGASTGLRSLSSIQVP